MAPWLRFFCNRHLTDLSSRPTVMRIGRPYTWMVALGTCRSTLICSIWVDSPRYSPWEGEMSTSLSAGLRYWPPKGRGLVSYSSSQLPPWRGTASLRDSRELWQCTTMHDDSTINIIIIVFYYCLQVTQTVNDDTRLHFKVSRTAKIFIWTTLYNWLVSMPLILTSNFCMTRRERRFY